MSRDKVLGGIYKIRNKTKPELTRGELALLNSFYDLYDSLKPTHSAIVNEHGGLRRYIGKRIKLPADYSVQERICVALVTDLMLSVDERVQDILAKNKVPPDVFDSLERFVYLFDNDTGYSTVVINTNLHFDFYTDAIYDLHIIGVIKILQNRLAYQVAKEYI